MPEAFQIDGICGVCGPGTASLCRWSRGCRSRNANGTSSQTLASLETEAAKRGAVLLVVQGVVSASEREAMLHLRGYTFASSWYAGPPRGHQAASQSSLIIRTAAAKDVLRILEIRDKKYDQYETFSPVFWKKRQVPIEQWAPFMTNQIESETNIPLVAEQGGAMRGFIIMSCRDQGFVDDYAVADFQTDWPHAGVALLAEAGRLAQLRNLASVTIIAGHADTPKRAAIESLGYILQNNWMVQVVVNSDSRSRSILPSFPLRR